MRSPAEGRVTVEPVELDAYVAAQDEYYSNRMRGGWARGYARQNQMLVYAGISVTPLDEALLRQALDHAGGSSQAVLRLGAAAISIMMTTGRSLDEIAELEFDDRSKASGLPVRPVLRSGHEWVWWLKPGSPSSEQRGLLTRAVLPDIVPIPCSARSRMLVEQCNPQPGQSLFLRSSDELASAAGAFLRSAKIKLTLSTIRRWLFDRLTWMEGGDVGIAALVTAHQPVLAQTVVHYTALPVPAIQVFVKRALIGFDSVVIPAIPHIMSGQRVGSRFAPSLDQVRQLVQKLHGAISSAKRRKNVPSLHNALTIYTIVLVHMHTGCRPSREFIPLINHMDKITRFLIVDDKPTRDNYKSRIIWISNDCDTQFALYESHIAALTKRLDDIGGLGSSPFWLTPTMKPKPLNRTTFRTALTALGWEFPFNAGRHFLRTNLVGVISTEGLHALLGHWHLGNEPWSAASSLDPIAYRSEIAETLEPLMRRCGLRPVKGLS